MTKLDDNVKLMFECKYDKKNTKITYPKILGIIPNYFKPIYITEVEEVIEWVREEHLHIKEHYLNECEN